MAFDRVRSSSAGDWIDLDKQKSLIALAGLER